VKNNYIWTYEFGDESKPHIVIIHGMGGSGMLFFKMFKKFAEHFHVYLIDLLGMGRSSRNDFECENYVECVNFFTNSIDKWRQNIGIEKMNLMGHSFGAFIASKYALLQPQNINKLVMFSPWASES
jgi:pimeloyl-ACP methyl ester carboxylesterase